MELNTFVESGHQFSKAPLEAMLATSIETRSQQAVVEERLPFSVRIVGSDEQLDKAVLVRHAAYGRHIPAVAAMLEKAEAVGQRTRLRGTAGRIQAGRIAAGHNAHPDQPLPQAGPRTVGRPAVLAAR
jgi:hypothetical protein